MFHLRSMLAASKRLLLCIILTLASFGAPANWVYGPPYSYNTIYGSEGGFLSVDAAIHSLISRYEADCTTPQSCKPHSFSAAYGTTGTAATITISWVNADGSTGSDLFAYIWASDVTGSGFQPKNAGGCRAMCTGGNGSPVDSLGPRGSSQEGDTKAASTDVGTSMDSATLRLRISLVVTLQHRPIACAFVRTHE